MSLSSWGDVSRLDFSPAKDFGGKLPDFADEVRGLLSSKNRVIVVTHQAKRLSELLEEEDIYSVNLDEKQDATPGFGAISITGGAVTDGWIMN